MRERLAYGFCRDFNVYCVIALCIVKLKLLLLRISPRFLQALLECVPFHVEC